MLSDYLTIVLFFGLGVALVGSAYAVSWILRPKAPGPEKNSPYECGEIIKGDARVQFNVRYYLFALIFVIFDVEILFTMPWAVVFRSLGVVAYWEMAAFILVLAFGLYYAFKKGALEWQ